jgi:hypothetical protein
MEPGMIGEMIGLVGAFFGGLIVLAPVVALSVRFGLKPLVEAKHRLSQGASADLAQDRRLALLEAEMQNIQASLQQLAEADDFRRQLATPAGRPVASVGP